MCLVGPEVLRQVFNDTDDEVLWLIVGAPEETEFLPGSAKTQLILSVIYPLPTQSNCRKSSPAWNGYAARECVLESRRGGLKELKP